MRLTGKRLLVLLLYSPTEQGEENCPIAGRTRLVKMCFLFKEEIWPTFNKDKSAEDSLPEFYAWKYGPFSRELYTDLEFLKNQGFISVAWSNMLPLDEEMEEYEHWIEDVNDFDSNELGEEVFSLTPDKGMNKGQALWKELSETQRRKLIKFKTSLVDISLDRLLLYVYRKYEDKYTSKSVIKDRYLY